MRVFIYGPPGAGKTTLALRLAARFGWPVHHLDPLFFHADGAVRDRAAVVRDLEARVQGACWIIEGNHGAAIETVACRADRVIVLRISRLQGLWRLVRRRWWAPPELSNKGPGGGPQRLPGHLVRYTLFVHPGLAPQHLAKITRVARGGVSVYDDAEAALASFTE